MMTRTTLFIIALVLGACTIRERNRSDVSEIIDADRAFSSMSASEGMASAFITYADEHVIKLNARQYPTVGKQELAKSLTADEFTGTLTWKPLSAEISDDLGYTFGDWKMTTRINDRDTTLWGNYVTIWKRQRDGSWKFVLDGGNPTPGPTPERLIELMRNSD